MEGTKQGSQSNEHQAWGFWRTGWVALHAGVKDGLEKGACTQ